LSIPIIHHKSSIINSDGFTLIELLVVISIIALLMAVLLPTLGRVRKQARAVACQSNLRQWGVVFFMYANEHNDGFPHRDPGGEWWLFARDYYRDCNELLLCPVATRYEINKNAPGYSRGSKFTAWKTTSRLPPSGALRISYGSYGLNYWLYLMYGPEPSIIQNPRNLARSGVPFVLDCAGPLCFPSPRGEPPAYDGDVGDPDMKTLCLDRHSGAINGLFMDWSVRAVGLKELWTLKWHKRFDTAGPWTQAGGVEAEDWPPWMRSFKDY
jgi:prepilin-type N-terminal cleavage/methylation domain-containing protein/prepilin-type processing-associated H-X9-DG protein